MLEVLGNNLQDPASMTLGVGIMVLISGGTFLFVTSMHILPTVLRERPLNVIELICLTLSMIVPWGIKCLGELAE